MTGLVVGVLIVAAVLGPLWWGQRRIERQVRARERFLTPDDRRHEETEECWCGPNVAAVKHDDGSVSWLYLHNYEQGGW